MRVIGTAGHVDHGKSTLIYRLTGIDPDRLKEEQARAMTIDLGFAWLPLPNGDTLGIVDVPGHRDFIGNMLAGVGGIDAVLFVIAADEGVMPQTREHLAILDLLGIQQGIIVLSKIDLVPDADWLALVQADVLEQFSGTSLGNAEIIPISARTGEGIPFLLDRIAALPPLPHPDLARPRLPIDRVFTMSGFGTVVTGTLLDGSLRVGDAICIEPSKLNGRIRGLQSYKQSVATAAPGTRVAVNISGIDRDSVQRGHVLTFPDVLIPTNRVDAHYRQLGAASRPLKHDVTVKLFTGTAETVARVRLLDAETLQPGAEGWLQLEFTRPLAVSPGDRFILRAPSPAETIGGGTIIDAHPARRWRRHDRAVIDALRARLHGSPAVRLAQAADCLMTAAELTRVLGCSAEEFAAWLAEAEKDSLVVCFSDGTLIASTAWQQLRARILAALRDYHAEYPLRSGMSREELRRQVGVQSLTPLLEELPEVVAEQHMVRLSDHHVLFDYAQQALIARLLAALDQTPLPSFDDALALVGTEILYALIDAGDIAQIAPTVILSRKQYEVAVSTALRLIDTDGSITAAALRDALNTSRKIAIALLEHMDAAGLTRRQGDTRVRRSSID